MIEGRTGERKRAWEEQKGELVSHWSCWKLTSILGNIYGIAFVRRLDSASSGVGTYSLLGRVNLYETLLLVVGFH